MMKSETIKIFAMRCDENKIYKGRLEEIDNTLEAKQKFVGGYIEVIRITDDIDIVLNDEGKLDGLPLNRVWKSADESVLDIIVGNVLACRHDEEGNFTSILESDIPVILKHLPAIMMLLGSTVFTRSEDELPEYEER